MNTNIDSLLNFWKHDPTIQNNIVSWQLEDARNAQYASFPGHIHTSIVQALGRFDIYKPYSHQVTVWEELNRGQNVVIVTGTASGKTLCYNVPVINSILSNRNTTALYLFPTRALTQDQYHSLSDFIDLLQQMDKKIFGQDDRLIPLATYDGDTPASKRSAIRTYSQILLTNPDMLHMAILPHHTNWERFIKNLQFIVIDEIHAYKGIFGSHVANVIRRLKRIMKFYGKKPQFILTSATIANPCDFAEKLVEEPVTLINDDGSPRGKKHFILYNPPVIQEELGIRKSALSESIRLTSDLLSYNIQTLIFTRTRRSVELILKYLQEIHSDITNRLHGYRSGYLARERREIERELKSGDALAVVSTNALELGIDIGGVDSVLLVGYPGTISSVRQQSGRAGRKSNTSLAVLLASPTPLDQFLIHHTDYLFEKSPECALINPDNLLILLEHIKCAAFELPFKANEGFGLSSQELVTGILNVLEQSNILHHSKDGYYWVADQYPAEKVSLRSATGKPVLLTASEDNGFYTIGEVDHNSALWMAHPGAIYLHEGKSFQVDDLDLENNTARLSAQSFDYYTEPRSEVTIEGLGIQNRQEIKGGCKFFGEILVSTRVIGYKKIQWTTHEVLSIHTLDMPTIQLRTSAVWFSLGEETAKNLRVSGLWRGDPNSYGANWIKQKDLARKRDRFTCRVCGIIERAQSHHVHHIVPFRSFTTYEQANRLDNLITLCPTCHQKAETAVRVRSGLSGLSYVLHHLAPLFLMCDYSDIDAFSEPESKLSNGLPTVVLYDLVPAGIGLCDEIYRIHPELLKSADELISNCACKDGCPSCVGPGGERGEGSKKETASLLEAICQD